MGKTQKVRGTSYVKESLMMNRNTREMNWKNNERNNGLRGDEQKKDLMEKCQNNGEVMLIESSKANLIGEQEVFKIGQRMKNQDFGKRELYQSAST